MRSVGKLAHLFKRPLKPVKRFIDNDGKLSKFIIRVINRQAAGQVFIEISCALFAIAPTGANARPAQSSSPLNANSICPSIYGRSSGKLTAQSVSSDSSTTLQDALEYTLEHSPRLESARQGITSEELNLNAAQALRWPSVDIGLVRPYGQPVSLQKP